MILLDKIKGGLLGLAIGDALGCSAEFMTPEQIKHKFGVLDEIKGGGPFSFQKGAVTDDTDMTLCIARGILKNRENPISSIGDEFVKWYDTNPKDIGNSTQFSIRYFKHCNDWVNASQISHEFTGRQSAGNGSLMRCLPIALIYKDEKTIVSLSKEQSRLTHWDELAGEACSIYNRIAFQILNGEDLKEAIKNIIKGTQFENSINEKPDSKPDGYVVNTMNWIIHLLINTESYEEVIIRAVNMGYDSDTTAAIAGGLAGVHYGFKNIPDRWLKEVLLKEEIENLASLICEERMKHE